MNEYCTYDAQVMCHCFELWCRAVHEAVKIVQRATRVQAA
jgi:hypothetical protein